MAGETAPDKGSSPRTATTDAFDRSNDLETAPLLAASSDPPAATSSPARKPTRLRHGRGPLVRDDSDDDGEPFPPNSSEDDDAVRFVAAPHPSLAARKRWSFGSVLCLVFSIVFVALLVALAAVHLWVGHLLSEQARHGDAEAMAQRGLVWAGPSAVRVAANTAGDGLVVELDGMAGIDVRKALDWEDKDDSKSWFRRQEGRIARWGVRKVRSVSVDVGQVALFDASAGSTAQTDPLVVVDSLDTLRLPLSYPSKREPLLTMHSFTLHVPLRFPAPHDLVDFGKAAWEAKSYRVRADVRDVVAQVGETGTRGVFGWVLRRMQATRVTGLERIVDGKLPNVPDTSDPSKLANVTSVDVYETPSPAHLNETVIAFAASALVQNPLADAIRSGRLPAFAWGMPFRLPVSIHLALPPLPEGASAHDPTEIMLAKVSTAPFAFPHDLETAQLDVTGHLVPAGNLTPSTPIPPPPGGPLSSAHSTKTGAPQQPPLSRALSRFVARYLAGRANDVFIRYDADPEPLLPSDPSHDAPLPPRFVSDLVANQTLHVRVPGTNETPELFRNLRMEDMRIKLGGGDDDTGADLLASGRVVGEVVLPEMAKKLADGIDAQSIWPDVLVYDGELPGRGLLERAEEAQFLDAATSAQGQLAFSSEPFGTDLAALIGDDDDTTEYPPSPVPANAFARMRPSSAMDASTIHIPANGTHNATTLVSATFVDAPLYLLPGRGDVLRRFVAKIIFGGPGNKVKASMAGITSVRIALSGFGEVELHEIPIEASFMVGRGGVENPPAF
ncbi:uncharacterized protein JCM10292_003563 [Rhodotorula paludigena]|uniref:uncharacterized protein n=1 Tax=Rhodotorula paludigena TaxID=86838 RepID=UPI00316CAE2B